MNRPVITIAAALIAATTFVNAKPAQAGMRLGFGVPLGMFVAHSLAESSRRQHYNDLRDQREARAARIAAAKREAAISAAKRDAAIAAKREAAAEERARKAKLAAKASEPLDEEVKTVKLENKAVTTDAAPTINVPAAPVAAATSTAVEAEVAKVGEINDAVKIAAPKTEQLQQVVTAEPIAQPVAQPVVAESTTSKAKRICRRFSAAIAGLVDVPCE